MHRFHKGAIRFRDHDESGSGRVSTHLEYRRLSERMDLDIDEPA